MGDPAVTKGKIQNVGTPGAVPIFQNAGAQPAAPAVPSNGDAYGLCATLEPLAAVPFLKGAVSFCQPVLERKAIDDEIKKLQDDIDPEDPGSAEANIRLMNLQTIKQDLDGIDGVIGDGSNIRRIEFAKLANVARRKFLNVAQNKSITNLGASSDFREANEIMMNLQLYMLLELKRTALQTLIDESYPMGFPLKYQLIFTDDDQKALGPFDADLEKLKGQPLFAEYAVLKASSKPEDQTKVAAFEKLIKHLKEKNSEYQASPSNLYGGAASLAQLKATVAELREVLGNTGPCKKPEEIVHNPVLSQFFLGVKGRELAGLKKDEGFKLRMNLQESIASLKKYDEIVKFQNSQEQKGLSGITVDGLKKNKDFLLERTSFYRERLVAEADQARNDNEHKRRLIVPSDEREDPSGGQVSLIPDPTWMSPEEQAARQRIEDFDKQVAKLQALTITDANRTDAFQSLKAATKDFFSLEEKIIRGLLIEMDHQVKKIPTFEDYLEPNAPKRFLTVDNIIDRFFDVDLIKRAVDQKDPSVAYPTIERRIKAYLDISSEIENTAILRTIEARQLMYIQYQETTRTADKNIFSPIINSVRGIGSIASSQEEQARVMYESLNGRAKYFDEILKRYKEVGILMASKDPADVEKGRQKFIQLEQCVNHRELEKINDGSERLNFVTAVGIVIAASFFGAGAGGLTRILLAETGATTMTGASTILFASNVFAFTASHELMTALFFHPESLGEMGRLFAEAVQDPFSEKGGLLVKKLGEIGFHFSIECLLNAGMMKFIGKMGEIYEKGAGKLISRLAERRVAAKFPKTISRYDTTVNKMVEVPNPAYEKALGEEIANLDPKNILADGNWKNKPLQAANWLGGLAWEGAWFVPWQVVPDTAHELTSGKYGLLDAILALPKVALDSIKKAFSASEIGSGFAFLFALKLGGIISHPLTKSMDSFVNSVVLDHLKVPIQRCEAKVADVQKRLEDFAEKGEGDFGQILTDMMNVLKEQKLLIDQIPEEYRAPGVEKLNQEGLQSFTINPSGKIVLPAGPRDQVAALPGNFGLRASKKKEDLFYYQGTKKTALVKALQGMPNIDRVEVRDNGVIVAEFKPGFVGTTTLRFRPEKSSSPQPFARPPQQTQQQVQPQL